MVSGLYQLLNASCMLCERSFSTHFLKHCFHSVSRVNDPNPGPGVILFFTHCAVIIHLWSYCRNISLY